MAGYVVVVKVRCKECMKRMTGENKCQCAAPKPERVEMRVMNPLRNPMAAPVREAVACAS